MEDTMADAKVALVTGISSGIGKATAAELAHRGFRVFGTVRSQAAETPDGIERLVLDVKDDASVQRAVADLVARAGRIDVVVNNAGTSIVGAIEETDLRQAQELFDVNFFGAVRTTRAVLPIMRRQRSGRIVFVSSVVGFLPAPFMGFYSASKHAIEGFGESLDHEVRSLGIRAILIEPGFMKTRLDQNSTVAANTVDDYVDARRRVAANIQASVQKGDDPVLVAKAIAEAATAPRPRLRYQVGKGAGLLATLRSIVPAPLFDRSLRREFHVDA
jgi:NAD(P)-dependent dehydrogenase (short-subunit alcohol dehydrogenase family)